VELSVQFVEITEGGGDDVGLDWLFGQSPTNNPVVQSGPATNLLSGAGAPHGQNLRVDLLRTEGQSATLTPMQLEALQSRLKLQHRVELLAAPKLLTLAGQQAHVEVSEPRNVVVAAKGIPGTSTNKASVQYETETIATGPTVNLLADEQDGGWKLTVLAKSTDFLGYDDPKSAVVTAEQPGQKPVTGQVPLPRLRVREVQAVVPVKNGETVALRGPLVEEVFRFKDKVVVLGDVPLLGRLFRTEGKTTLHKRLYIFVTPVEVTADGRRK
jgi:type II secretory pathway component GspD/PulD (secretin)